MAYSTSSRQGFCFEWEISSVLAVTRLDSEEFLFNSHRWKLEFRRDIDFIYIDLIKINPENLTETYTIRCFIEDTRKSPILPFECYVNAGHFNSKRIRSIAQTLLKEQSDTYLTDGTLKFVMLMLPNDTKKVEMDKRVLHKSVQTSCSMDTVACLENLSHDLEHLLGDKTQSDMTFNCEERSFLAHKVILSARSAVFSAMSPSNMSENRTGMIEITDIDASILHQFLLFVYSGKLSDLSVDTVSKLYAVADKYAVESLKKLCSKFMKENLARENACRFLITADVYGDKELKDCALNLITNIELFLDECVWFAFHDEYPKLASEVIHHAYKTKCFSKHK